ncbi:peptidylprolyl isomerase [Roseateles chitosanitabidus]|jgi:peptidyl-prolyl cis-trans isomerase A (cyclophilin A)|uniref:peptidylprolyl isomerase n=1 Tax=Roseateles chitosanitabidus TaxID=65048 RepID=UPI00082FA605|nr:peptidylprolyl isomerase [Roseateles chitosanitabidus]MBO9689652.1 peptidyl-prolyl cis-trans isomerase [Roseateles chitosanitabidus]
MRTSKLLLGLGAAALSLACSLAHAQVVKLSTTMGDIKVQLDPEKAPKTVANFVAYVKAGHYNGVIFHRVIDGFMIQTGGYTPDLKQKPTKAPIPLEAGNGLMNIRGSIAMARTGDPNSATSQFFINVVDNPGLDPGYASDGRGYAVFGYVTEGMDVVDKIREVQTSKSPKNPAFQNLPNTPILINKATVEK